MSDAASFILVACNLVIFGAIAVIYADERRRADARFEADMAKFKPSPPKVTEWSRYVANGHQHD